MCGAWVGFFVYLFGLHSLDTGKDHIMECNAFLTLGLKVLESSATSEFKGPLLTVSHFVIL